MSYIKPQITPPSPLIFAILNGGSKQRKILNIWLGGRGGGDAWGEVWFGSFLQRLMVFWWFPQTYMTSGPCSSWFFLVVKSWFFWCYLGLQAMAILFWAAKNSLRGTTTVYVTSSELGLSHPLSRQRVCPSPQNGGGGTLARGWGVGGVPITTTG
jgi:hypothetical protein